MGWGVVGRWGRRVGESLINRLRQVVRGEGMFFVPFAIEHEQQEVESFLCGTKVANEEMQDVGPVSWFIEIVEHGNHMHA